MLVKEKMTPNPLTITKSTNIASALQIMRENKIRRLPVLDGEKIVGIVTDRDLSEVSPSPATSLSIFELNYLLSKTKIGDILPKNKDVITISENTFLEEAALLMREHKIGGIPVTNDNGTLVGIITETNIFDAFIDIMGFKQEGYRITIRFIDDQPGMLADITNIIASSKGNITHITTFYDEANHPRLVIRINQGNIDKIMDSLKENGYEGSITSVKDSNK